MTLHEIIEEARKLSRDEQVQLIKLLVDMIVESQDNTNQQREEQDTHAKP